MPAVQCACPSCRTLLQLDQALPVAVRCPRCNGTFMVGAPPPPQNATPLPPASGSRPLPHIPAAAITAASRRGGSGVVSAPATLRRPAPSPGRRKGLALFLSLGAGALLVGLVLLLVLNRGGKREDDDPTVDADGVPFTPHERKFNKAIRRGVAYLKSRLTDGSNLYSIGDSQGGGAHPGAVALAGLTLLECGVPPTDPALQTALNTVRSQAPQLSFTYSIAVSILFLDRLNNPAERSVDANDRRLIQSMALRLVAGQNRNGGWAYFCPPLASNLEEALQQELEQGRFVPGTFVVPGKRPFDRDDNSIGQFATLALWQARKHGVKVKTSLRAVEQRYRPRQHGDGSWTYTDGAPFVRDTSTCAGLIGLAVARGVEDEDPPRGMPAPPGGRAAIKDIRKDPAVEKGLRYLGRVVGKVPTLTEAEQDARHRHTEGMEDVMRELETASDFDKLRLALKLRQFDNPAQLRGIYFDGDNWGDLYFLWSLERMAVIYDLKQIDGRDWYAWGSEIILKHQQDDGSWSERFPGVPDTCFALLFLKRANVVKDLTDKLRRARGEAQVGAAPGNRPAPGTPAVPKRKE